jgi:MFS family permease
MAIASDVFVQRRRAVALGIIGAAVEVGGALGPFYGAALSQFWGWRWIFWVNLPIGLLAIGVVLLFLRHSPRATGKVDYFGGLLLAASLALFCLGISQQSAQSHFLVYLISFLVVALFLFILFMMRAARIPDPLVRLSMFRNASFSAANITNLLVGGALIIALVNIPLMSDTIMGRSPLEGGLRLLRLTIALSVGAVIGGFLCKRVGYRLPTALGLILGSAGFFFMSQWPLAVADPRMTLDLATCGLGLGLVIAPLATAVIDSAGADQRGIASSLIVMMRMVGMMIGLSAITSWGMGRFHLMTASMSLADIVTAPERLTGSLLSLFHDFFLAAMVVCLIAVIPALWPARPSPAPKVLP